ncbi:hypothetical protein EON67_04915 [archaeon]|nr:MAG: hypothetical protein EON67_04915 [archaeon]
MHVCALVLQILLGEVDGTPGLISDKLQVGAHTEAVWQVKWVARQDVGEVLVSVSTDGRVTQWDCKKGAYTCVHVRTRAYTCVRACVRARARACSCSAPTSRQHTSPALHARSRRVLCAACFFYAALAPTPLMTLKRARALGAPAAAPNAAATTDAPVPGAASTAAAGGNGAAPPPPAAGADILGLPAGTAVGDGILARTASGLTVDFVPSDTTQYFVGTCCFERGQTELRR